MSQPVGPRPLSVVTIGNSVAVLQNPPRTRRADGTWTEVLVDHLRAEGIAAQGHLEARWFDFVDRGLDRYQQAVRPHMPDVLVVAYGINELQPWLLPVPVVRHLITRHAAVTRPARWYRRVVAERVWRVVRRYRRWAAPRVGLRTWQMTPDRFAGKLTALVRAARVEHACLVLVMDINPPGPILRHFLPGIEARHARFQQVLADAVAAFGDPDVRLVPTSAVIADLDDADAMPDGQHLTVEAHRRVGRRLAEEVLAWHAEREVRHPGEVSRSPRPR